MHILYCLENTHFYHIIFQQGEITAIVFAFCFHLTNEKIFELLETTLIAALVSIHMIQSRDEHWDKEKDLEKDIIGLQLYIEHYATNNNHDVEDINVNDDIESNVKGSSGIITSSHDGGTAAFRVQSIEEGGVQLTLKLLIKKLFLGGRIVWQRALTTQFTIEEVVQYSMKLVPTLKLMLRLEERRTTTYQHSQLVELQYMVAKENKVVGTISFIIS